METSRDYYTVLGVAPDATPDEIRKAYRQLARQYHPDAQELPGTAMLFRELQAAYEVLGDAAKRAAYDRARAETGFSSESAFQMRLQCSREMLPCIEEEQILYVLVNIQAAQSIQRRQRLPLNLCLVLDRSTSMQGPRLEQVKAATCQLIDTLDKDDRFSVVTFSDHAEIVWTSQAATDALRAKAKVNAIQASGGTEILQGMSAGLGELEKGRPPANHQPHDPADRRTNVWRRGQVPGPGRRSQEKRRQHHVYGIGRGLERYVAGCYCFAQWRRVCLCHHCRRREPRVP